VSVTERRLELLIYASLLTLTLIIFTGAAVRLTGSGLGCQDWPRCNGRDFLPELSGHTLIEFGNRMVTGVVGLPCLLTAIFAFKLRRVRRDLLLPALALPLGVLAQAVIGGITVLLDLTWQVVIVHYLVSCLLLVSATLLAYRIRRPPNAARIVGDRLGVLLTRVLVVYGGAVVVAGTFATAAGPHAGGAGTGDVSARLTGLTENTTRSVILWHGHAAAVLGGLCILMWFLAGRRRLSGDLQLGLAAVCVLMGLQGVIGLVQYHNALPAFPVWVHTSLAAVLWVAFVWCWLVAGRLPRRTA
jgi:heme a synthase